MNVVGIATQVNAAKQNAQALRALEPTDANRRELSIAITHLEDAEMRLWRVTGTTEIEEAP